MSNASQYYEAAYLDQEEIPHVDLLVATQLADAMVENFALPPSLVSVIPVRERPDIVRAAVVYTGDGLDMGGWDEITAEEDADEFLIVTGDGILADSRAGMEWPVYAGMVHTLQARAKLEGRTFNPSSLTPASEDGSRRTRTWITGYYSSAANDEHALVGYVDSNGVPGIKTYSTASAYATIGFRPSVVVRPELIAQYYQANPISGLDM